MFNGKQADISINGQKDSPIYKTAILMARLPQRQQERIYDRMEGYLDGYASANGKREAGHRQPQKAAAH